MGAAKQFLGIFFLCPSSQIVDDSGLGNWALAFSALALFFSLLFYEGSFYLQYISLAVMSHTQQKRFREEVTFQSSEVFQKIIYA